MSFLKALNSIKNDFPVTKIVHHEEKDPCNWQIYPFAATILSIDSSLLIELEDGTEFHIEAGKSFEIPTGTFHKITPLNKNARFLFATKAA